MPGKVVALLVTQGQSVQQGDPLVIMEAMKMEHTITAPHDGVVDAVLYALGDQVAEGAPLLVFSTVAAAVA
jgi:3-methylcrotonyl-CoA carboxylase alpha subunit